MGGCPIDPRRTSSKGVGGCLEVGGAWNYDTHPALKWGPGELPCFFPNNGFLVTFFAHFPSAGVINRWAIAFGMISVGGAKKAVRKRDGLARPSSSLDVSL